MVLLLTVCAAFASEDNTIPMAEAVALLLLLALAMERSRTRFPEIVQVPVVTLIRACLKTLKPTPNKGKVSKIAVFNA